jgi:uncharacterized membrane protein (UPF0182 family)
MRNIVAVLLVIGGMGLFYFFPNYYWFESLNASHVYLTTLAIKCLVFFSAFVPVVLAYSINQFIVTRALKQAEIIQPRSSHPLMLKLRQLFSVFFGAFDAAKLAISSPVKWGAIVLVSFVVAKAFSGEWQQIGLAANAMPFSISDPIFNTDVSFYIFKLPALNHALATAKFVVVTMLIYSLWHYLRRGHFFFSAALPYIRWHVLGLLSVFFGLNALSSFLIRYNVLFKNNSIIFGGSYTDTSVYLAAVALLPMVWLTLVVVAVSCMVKPWFRWLALGGALAVGYYALALNGIPWLVQNYVVAPNEFKKERPYIRHNIHYTQLAYQLNHRNEIDMNYQKTFQITNQESFNSTLNNVRLWNPEPLKSTLKQLQEIRLYYEFKNVDIDRYIINGQTQQVMLSARELDINQLPDKAQTWVNRRLMYTHGYGLCMVPVNQFNSEGLPELIIRDIPPINKTNVRVTRPEIYFGESTNHYVVVNSKQKEFDYPKDNQNRYVHYQGSGGIALNSWFKRLIFAIKFKDIKLLISQNIHKQSRLMFDRNIWLIPKKIAPFIAYDADPYLVVNDSGHLKWMVDGYTASSYFPYSTPYSKRINYVRNSVLVTIDAYSGETQFYIKDDTDPIIQAYSAMYPRLFKSLSMLPDDLKSHIRFPKDLFKITTKIYNTYHMTDPQVFYNKEDVWALPTETYDSDTGITMEPYYMVVQNPENQSFEYALIMPLTPSNKNNLVAILMASSQPNRLGKLTVYRLPKQETVYGPMQIESRIDQNTDISKDLTLWGQVGSRVIRGNLMVIPYETSILYVEPIYLQATQSKLPELKRVIVAFGDQLTMASSINEGIFTLTKGAVSRPSPPGEAPKSSKELTKKIVDAYSRVKEKLRQSDWAAVGKAMESLDQLMDRLKKEQ